MDWLTISFRDNKFPDPIEPPPPPPEDEEIADEEAASDAINIRA